MYLEKINSPSDLKKLDVKQLDVLCREIREYLIDTVLETGGHLASNLGVVELTVALLYVFDEGDKFIWDVGHQSYVYKILTGRRDEFVSLRKKDGISGFSNPSESKYDAFVSGHASTSISIAEGLAEGRDKLGSNFHVTAILGDGALTGGMSYEALNNISGKRMLVILNDNEMSISKNVGGVSVTLSKLRLSKGVSGFRYGVGRFFRAIPLIGRPIAAFAHATKRFFKSLFGINMFFDNFNMHYIGPCNGHKLKKLISILRLTKKDLENPPKRKAYKPILLHVVTKKGKGYKPAEENPQQFHHVSNETENANLFSTALGEKLVSLAEKNEKIVAISAAMPDGTGLKVFADKFPNRFFDVGIAESHAVAFAAGMAKEGLRPYVAIYSTFLQRAFDQILHDVCLQSLPVVFCVDRAGFVGPDGETHQGLFDLSYLQQIPNICILAPKDINEFNNMLDFTLTTSSPFALRYPRNCNKSFVSTAPYSLKWELVKDSKGKCTIFAVGGNMLEIALLVAKKFPGKINVVNARTIKPIDIEMLLRLKENSYWIVVEENVETGGLGSRICTFAAREDYNTNIKLFSINDKFVPNAEIPEQMAMLGVDYHSLEKFISSII